MEEVVQGILAELGDILVEQGVQLPQEQGDIQVGLEEDILLVEGHLLEGIPRAEQVGIPLVEREGNHQVEQEVEHLQKRKKDNHRTEFQSPNLNPMDSQKFFLL